MERERTGNQRGERGTVMVIAALAMTALLLFAALAIDVGAVWLSRTQNQNADDAAALAAAQKMHVFPEPGVNAPVTVDRDAAISEGQLYAGANATVGEAVSVDMGGNRLGGVTVETTDFTFGNWNLATQTFTPLSGADLDDPDKVRAVRVDVRMDGSANAQSPAFLSRLLGIGGYSVRNDAIAYRGFMGHFDPKWFNFPVALDSCELQPNPTDECGTDFCSYNTDRAAGCPLERAQPDTNGILCGDLSSTPEQDMCFTVFDGDHTAVTPKELEDCVDEPCNGELESGDDIYVDNGDKTVVVDYIRDKFYGCGDFDDLPQHGQPKCGGPNEPACGPYARDEYGTGFPNSWVRKLPVIECQDDTNCSHRDPYAIMCGVCFEIREVIAPMGEGQVCERAPPTGTGRWIKGRALCRNSTNAKVRELFNKYCNDPNDPPAAPGGCNYSFDADHVVLVQ